LVEHKNLTKHLRLVGAGDKVTWVFQSRLYWSTSSTRTFNFLYFFWSSSKNRSWQWLSKGRTCTAHHEKTEWCASSWILYRSLQSLRWSLFRILNRIRYLIEARTSNKIIHQLYRTVFTGLFSRWHDF